MAEQQIDLAGAAREEDGCLPGRVAAADHGNRGADAELLLHEGGLVVDPTTLEVLKPLDREAAIAGAGGDQQRARFQRRAVVERDRVGSVPELEPDGGGSDDESGAELARLDRRSFG